MEYLIQDFQAQQLKIRRCSSAHRAASGCLTRNAGITDHSLQSICHAWKAAKPMSDPANIARLVDYIIRRGPCLLVFRRSRSGQFFDLLRQCEIVALSTMEAEYMRMVAEKAC